MKRLIHRSPEDQAVDAIRKAIETGRFEAGSFLPPETGLSQEIGVGRGSVRTAIERLVASGEIVRRPYARPRIAGRKARPAGEFGRDIPIWISRRIGDEQSLQMLQGISRTLRGTPYRMLVHEPSLFEGDVVAQEERAFLERVATDPAAAGAIVERDACRDHSDLFRAILAAGKPLVFVDTPPPEGVVADFVGTANAAAARRCVEHLIADGHRRIVMLTDNALVTPVQERIKGYRRAMVQNGLGDEARVIVAAELPRQEPDHEKRFLSGPYAPLVSMEFSRMQTGLIDAVLALDPLPTALFAAYDVLAYSVCALLEGAGHPIPERFSVVGFDWLGRWRPDDDTLTSASQDFGGFGAHSAELLLDRLEGSVSPAQSVLLDAPLVVRPSTRAQPRQLVGPFSSATEPLFLS